MKGMDYADATGPGGAVWDPGIKCASRQRASRPGLAASDKVSAPRPAPHPVLPEVASRRGKSDGQRDGGRGEAHRCWPPHSPGSGRRGFNFKLACLSRLFKPICDSVHVCCPLSPAQPAGTSSAPANRTWRRGEAEHSRPAAVARRYAPARTAPPGAATHCPQEPIINSVKVIQSGWGGEGRRPCKARGAPVSGHHSPWRPG